MAKSVKTKYLIEYYRNNLEQNNVLKSNQFRFY